MRKKEWERLSPKEQQKLISTVEKRIRKKLKKDPSFRRLVTVKEDNRSDLYKREKVWKQNASGNAISVKEPAQETAKRNTVYSKQKKYGRKRKQLRYPDRQKEPGVVAKENYLREQVKKAIRKDPVLSTEMTFDITDQMAEITQASLQIKPQAQIPEIQTLSEPQPQIQRTQKQPVIRREMGKRRLPIKSSMKRN